MKYFYYWINKRRWIILDLAIHCCLCTACNQWHGCSLCNVNANLQTYILRLVLFLTLLKWAIATLTRLKLNIEQNKLRTVSSVAWSLFTLGKLMKTKNKSLPILGIGILALIDALILHIIIAKYHSKHDGAINTYSPY